MLSPGAIVVLERHGWRSLPSDIVERFRSACRNDPSVDEGQAEALMRALRRMPPIDPLADLDPEVVKALRALPKDKVIAALRAASDPGASGTREKRAAARSASATKSRR